MDKKGPVSDFMLKHYKHFNAAAMVDAAKGYELHLEEGKKMLVSLAGAMSTAELGISFAEMIRQDKVQIISCTGANLEEDIMNLNFNVDVVDPTYHPKHHAGKILNNDTACYFGIYYKL